jgi:hypothetical protein
VVCSAVCVAAAWPSPFMASGPGPGPVGNPAVKGSLGLSEGRSKCLAPGNGPGCGPCGGGLTGGAFAGGAGAVGGGATGAGATGTTCCAACCAERCPYCCPGAVWLGTVGPWFPCGAGTDLGLARRGTG